ncbi:MAG: DUF6491 family protein [Steroidobacteraceae bacterium]
MSRLTPGLLAGLLATGLAATPAFAADAAASQKGRPIGQEASIPFVQHGGVRDWEADGRNGLWLQDSTRQWYYAKTLGPCIGLDFAWSIALDSGHGAGPFDRFSSIILPDHQGRCALTSLTYSKAPPKRQKKPAKPKDGAAPAAAEPASS